MKRCIKKCAALTLAALLLLLTGCDALDYQEAIDLYNAREFSQAAELFAQIPDYEDSAQLYTRARYWQALELYNAGEFSQAAEVFAPLGDYEDSQQLHTRCYYHLAVQAMEAGDYADAISRFEALEGYEDSAQRITECQYQLAVAAFQAEDYAAAEAQFSPLGDYRMSRDYLRQMGWQRFFDWVVSNGQADGTGFSLQTQQDGRTVSITADTDAPNRLILKVEQSVDKGYTYSDTLTIVLPREEAFPTFTGVSTFSMVLGADPIGTTQESIGRLELATCTADTKLSVESYTKTGTDNHGNAISSQDPAHSTMYEAMTENFRALLNTLPQLLAEHNAEVTLADLGFPK